jgi:hypothetical protein
MGMPVRSSRGGLIRAGILKSALISINDPDVPERMLVFRYAKFGDDADLTAYHRSR